MCSSFDELDSSELQFINTIAIDAGESSNQNNQKCSRQEIAEWVSIPSEMKTTVLHSIAYS